MAKVENDKTVDWSRLVDLAKELDDPDWQVVKNLLQMFLTTTESKLDELRAYIRAGNTAGVAEVAHFLKSSAASLGMKRFSALCRAIELDAKRDDSGGFSAAEGELTQEFCGIREEVAYIDKRKAEVGANK